VLGAEGAGYQEAEGLDASGQLLVRDPGGRFCRKNEGQGCWQDPQPLSPAGSDYLRDNRGRFSRPQPRPFAQAREYVRSLSLKNPRKWRQWCTGSQRPLDIPHNPWAVYQEWTNLFDFIGCSESQKAPIPPRLRESGSQAPEGSALRRISEDLMAQSADLRSTNREAARTKKSVSEGLDELLATLISKS